MASRKAYEERLLSQIREVLLKRTGVADRLIEDEDYVLALAQHYGAPTRLLDWTRSPAVAAYFAASSALRLNSAEFSVFALANTTLNSHRLKQSKFISPPMGGNENVAAQRGLFLKYSWDLEDPWAPELNEERPLPPKVDAKTDARFIRFDFPTAKAHRLINELLAHGVEGVTLFPGAAGVVDMALTLALSDLQRS